MATLTIKNVPNTGINPATYMVPITVSGDTFANYGNHFVVVENGDVGAITVTFSSVQPITVNGLPYCYQGVTIPVGESRYFAEHEIVTYGTEIKVEYTGATVLSKIGVFAYAKSGY